MMTWARFAAGSVAAIAVAIPGVLYAASGQQGLDRLHLQEQMELLSDASDQIQWQAGAPDDGSSAAAAQDAQREARQQAPAMPAEPDPKLEQTRLRLEQELREQREMAGDFGADPVKRGPSMRFGVGYEFRMKGRQELGFDAPGNGAAGFGGGGMPGAGNGAGFGGGRR